MHEDQTVGADVYQEGHHLNRRVIHVPQSTAPQLTTRHRRLHRWLTEPWLATACRVSATLEGLDNRPADVHAARHVRAYHARAARRCPRSQLHTTRECH